MARYVEGVPRGAGLTARIVIDRTITASLTAQPATSRARYQNFMMAARMAMPTASMPPSRMISRNSSRCISLRRASRSRRTPAIDGSRSVRNPVIDPSISLRNPAIDPSISMRSPAIDASISLRSPAIDASISLRSPAIDPSKSRRSPEIDASKSRWSSAVDMSRSWRVTNSPMTNSRAASACASACSGKTPASRKRFA